MNYYHVIQPNQTYCLWIHAKNNSKSDVFRFIIQLKFIQTNILFDEKSIFMLSPVIEALK